VLTCFRLLTRNLIQSVHEAHIGAGNQVAVGVDRDLDRAVSHLFLYVDNRCSVLEKQGPEGMAEIVKANLANASLGQDGEEYPMVEVIRVENRPLRGTEDEFVRDVVLALQVSLQQTFISQLCEYPPEFTGRSTRLDFLLLVVVCSRRT
jgi:hypothetical protein